MKDSDQNAMIFLLIAAAFVISIFILLSDDGYIFGSGLIDTVDPDIVCNKKSVDWDGIVC